MHQVEDLTYYLRFMNVDVLIVGCGLAGASLAMRFVDAGQKVVVIDHSERTSASRVAAGVFNPVVFKRINLSWRAIESLNASDLFYADLARRLNAPFYHKIPMVRCHGSSDERELWLVKRELDEFKPFLGETLSRDERPWLNQPFGAALVHGTGFLDTELFLDTVQAFLKSHSIFLNEDFEHTHVYEHADSIQYKEFKANKLIFCEGSSAISSSYFKGLPFSLAKGEVLTVEIPGIPDELFNGKIYGVPLGNSVFRVGATYTWNEAYENPTEAGRAELEEKIRTLIQKPFNVLKHDAGFRPATKDRRPYLGMHPKHKNIGIFNGLGTKGVLLSPMLSLELSQHLLHNKALDMESSIARLRPEMFQS
jgi:glycine oxidase